MSRQKGLIKMQSYINRMQQRQDWKLLISLIGKEINEPDWSKSVNKIDQYMELVCKENNIDFNNICGCGN